MELVGLSLSTGAIYALVGLGMAVIYQATGVFNFAQGQLVTVLAYVGLSLLRAHWPFFAAAGLDLVFAQGAGMALWVLVRPFRTRPPLVTSMATLSLYLVLRDLVVPIWGADPLVLPAPWAHGEWRLGGMALSSAQGVAILVAALVAAGMAAFFRRTRMGIALRAVRDHPQAASLMGVDADRLGFVVFGAATVIGAVAGLVLAPMTVVAPTMMDEPTLGAFAALVLGGIDTPWGVLLGAMGLGGLETVAGYYLASIWKEAVPLLAVLAVVVIRAGGLLGGEEVPRA
ncbi:MAG: branched-chain amino acid ABC transporter permease [Firmicutes bacterium]|nr:branched-chain amino acid ABC transporter permease [Alicyclobacillaceae bacterium]MCL6496757.1 branched-chain amino acid ABC transporter permease [Bacillota bacterium]